jgi:aspartate carbamoyltransferase catalytic subunit
MGHILEIAQFTRDQLEDFFQRVRENQSLTKRSDAFKGKTLCSVFYSASLRTKLGFESAMVRLGGSCISVDTAVPRSIPNSYEAIQDVIRGVSPMCDILIIRSNDPRPVASLFGETACIVVNGGNGPGPSAEHPVQAIADLFFMSEKFDNLQAPSVLLVGSLDHRVIRSLIHGFAIFGKREVHVSFPDSHAPMQHDVERWRSMGLTLRRVDDVSEQCIDFDVVYHNGIPRDPGTQTPGQFCLDAERVRRMREGSLVMHSLPRTEEYPEELDQLPHAAYFDQADTGYRVKLQILHDLVTRGTIA